MQVNKSLSLGGTSRLQQPFSGARPRSNRLCIAIEHSADVKVNCSSEKPATNPATNNADENSTRQHSVRDAALDRRNALLRIAGTAGVLSASSVRPGVAAEDDFVTLPSGLKVLTIREGQGPQPRPGDTVVVHWAGFTKGYQGKRIDNTSIRDEPYEFTLGAGQAIKAFELAVQNMRVGGIARVEVPGELPELSYPLDRSARFTGDLVSTDFKIYKYRFGPQPAELGGQRALDFVLDNRTLKDFNRTLLFDIKLLGRSGSMATGAREPWQQASVTLHFTVAYPTQWGQNILLCGSGALLGNLKWSQARQMSCHHEKDLLVWEATIMLPWKPSYTYRYALARQKEDETASGPNVHGNWLIEKEDAADERIIWLPEGLQGGELVEVCDTWIERSHPAALMASAAFNKVLFSHKPFVRGDDQSASAVIGFSAGETVVRLLIGDPQLEPGEALLVTGGIPQLGNWQPDQMLRLSESSTPFWEVEFRVPYSGFPFTYKYAIHTADGLVLEVGEPRLASLPSSASVGAPTIMVRQDGYFRRDRHWRGAGVAVPVFSLRTYNSVGVGEFLDLIPLVDLADKCGLRMIQVLPVNDTCVYGTWWDSYPYSTLSVHALHPQYLALRELLAEEGQELPHDLAAELHKARCELDGPHVDYTAMMAFKSAFVKKVYDRYGKSTLQGSAFTAWFAANSSWLRPYAAFCFLRDIFQTAEHWRWGCMSGGGDELVDRLTAPGGEFYPRIQLIYYVQYHLHRQLLKASDYAASKRVVLKGDLPIGVDKRSVDTWRQPHLFRMDKSTGAPPDAFSPTGQNWGFPTYDWPAMAADGYAWWRSRLSHLAQYFTAYRIDHVLGFFRIWEVPGDCVTGLLGYFRPSRPITRSELEQRGVWDVDRLTRPHITMALIRQIFGAEQAEVVAATYMLEEGNGKFRLRPSYSSEAAIAAIPLRPDSPPWLVEEVESTRTGLIKLRQNVVLLPDPEDSDAFHPRFNLMSTSSFASLPPPWRAALRHMHDDYYFRRQEEVWRASALSKLPALQAASDMLVCGEDLGFVPACVPPVMKELGLIGLRIQRMATDPGREFNNPAAYPYLTVASPSCHDVTPLRAWYESDPDRAERFYYQQLGGVGPPPPQCDPVVVRAVLQQHINCGSMLAIFPLQDLMALSSEYATRPAEEEVINDPTVAKHYWRFRIHMPIETLLSDSEWLATIAEMLVLGERATPDVLSNFGVGPGLSGIGGVMAAEGVGLSPTMVGMQPSLHAPASPASLLQAGPVPAANGLAVNGPTSPLPPRQTQGPGMGLPQQQGLQPPQGGRGQVGLASLLPYSQTDGLDANHH